MVSESKLLGRVYLGFVEEGGVKGGRFDLGFGRVPKMDGEWGGTWGVGKCRS